MDWLEEHGFSERFGARELKRVIERHVLTPISRLLVRGHDTYRGKTVVMGADEQGLTFEVEDKPSQSKHPDFPKTPSISKGDTRHA